MGDEAMFQGKNNPLPQTYTSYLVGELMNDNMYSDGCVIHESRNLKQARP